MKDYREITENVLRRRDQYEAKKRRRYEKIHKVTSVLSVIVITIAFLFTTGTCYVFAVGLGIIEDTFGICSKVFPGIVTQKQQAYVQSNMVGLGDTTTCNGVSVTVQSALTDGTTAYILLHIKAPEQMDLTQYGLHFDIATNGIVRGENPSSELGAGSVSFGQRTVDDQDGAKNTQDMVLQIDSAGGPGSTFSFADGYNRYILLENLYFRNAESPHEKTQLAEGNWNFRILFDNANCTIQKEMLTDPIRLTAYRRTDDSEQSVIVRSIVVKGLSMEFYYSLEDSATQKPGHFKDVKVVLSDGTTIDMQHRSGQGTGSAVFTVYLASSPIIVEEIDYVQVGDVKIHGRTVSN